MSGSGGWIGVDLDGTLAHYDGWRGEDHIGAPIAAMVARVKAWRAEGREVRIFTARVFEPWAIENGFHIAPITKREVARVIEDWCAEHLGEVLPIVYMKDYGMVELWDDRAVQVIPNTGQRADGTP
jgi:hypothetical protein